MNSDQQKSKSELIEEIEYLRAKVQKLEGQALDLRDSADSSNETTSSRGHQHYLKKELYTLIKTDSAIFDFFQKGSLDGIWYWDLENPENEWMSPEFWHLFGYEPEEKKHFSSEWQDMIFPEDLEVAKQNLSRHCEDPNYPFDQVVRYRHKNGSTVWVRCRGIAIRNHDGTPIRMLGAHNNYTIRKETARLYQLITENSKDSIWSMDSDLNFTYISPYTEHIFGYSLKEWHSLDWDKVVSPVYLSSILDSFASMVDGKYSGSINSEVLMFHKDGSEVWVEYNATPLYDDTGKLTEIVGVTRDITDRKKAELAFEYSEQRWHHILVNSPQIGISINANGIITFANKHFLSLTGWRHEEIIGENWFEKFIPESLREKIVNIFETVMKQTHDHGYSTYENNILHRNGTQLTIAWSNVLTLDMQGYPIDVTCMGIDVTERRRAEETLRESEQKLRLLFEETLNPILVVDEAGKYVDANSAALDFLECTKSDLLTKHIWDWVPQEMLAQQKYEHQPLIKRKTLETDYLVKNKIKTLLLNIFPVESKGVTHIYGVGQDITDRKRSELLLKESEAKFRSAFDSSPDAVNINRISDGLYIEINQGFTSLTGYTREDVSGKTSKELDIWCDSKDRETLVDELKKHGFYSNLQAEFRKKDKSTTTALMSARVITLNGEPHVISITRDISNRIKAEKLLTEARNEFESIFENSHVGIMFLRGGRILYRSNQRLADILGFDSPEDMAGISMRKLHLDESHFSKFGECYYKKLSLGEQTQIEYQLKKKNGEPIWCILSGKAIDPSDLQKGVIWVVDDLSNRKTMEENLVLAKEKAEEASKIKSEFLANMSHEIRTPMNGILGMLQLLQMTSINEEQKEYLLTAIQSSKRLTRLLSDILDLSRVEANRLSLQSNPLNLSEVVLQTCELFKPTAQQTQLKFLCNVDPKIPHNLKGDAARLQQVLTNIIGNAFKFTKEGSVTVEAYSLPTSAQNMFRVLFSISDTGIGIPDEKVNDLFKAFSQVSTGYRRDYQGAGLGLSICRKLIEIMGGSISIETKLGEGTTVYFCVTFIVDEPMSRPENSSSLPSSNRPLRILLAEDESVNRIATTKLLEKKGHAIKAVENGQKAVSQLKDGSFDVILMDIQMPVMDGVEATKAIRRGESGQDSTDIPIIAMTAYAMDGDREKFLATGMNGYVAKPVDINELQKEVNEALGINKAKQ